MHGDFFFFSEKLKEKKYVLVSHLKAWTGEI